MIDLILATFVVGVFYGGFWAGAKYGTLKTMINSIVDLVRDSK